MWANFLALSFFEGIVTLFQNPSHKVFLIPYFQIQHSDRETIARLRNCVLTLTDHGVMLFNTSLQYAYDASLKYLVSTWVARQCVDFVVFWFVCPFWFVCLI